MKTIYKKLLFLFLLLPFSILAQNVVNGVVVDKKTNQPISGVNVSLKGSNQSTSSDFDGKFKLSKVKKGDKIQISYVGYKNETITFEDQKTLVVSLIEEANVLQDVVVQVGYGSVKKKDATGSVEVLTTKEMNKGYVSTVEGLLNGRAAGVVVTQGGRPGDGAAIRIRGESSLYGKNDPLVVVDGVPIENGLNSINPNDIETISVLKDASSTAIYGNRASAGVIMITTKKGTKGDVKVSFNSNITINTLAKKLDVTSADDFRAFLTNPANISFYNINQSRIDRMGTASTDWQNEIFSNSVTMDNFISMRGSLFNKIPSSLSIGNSYIPGILKTSNYDRTTTALRLNPSLFKDHLKIAINSNITITKNRFADEGAIRNAITFDPTQSVTNNTGLNGGYFEWYDTSGNPIFLGTDNPVATLMQTNNTNHSYRYLANIQADYKLHFFPDLKFTAIAAIDRSTGTSAYELSNQSISGLYNNGVGLGNKSEGWGTSTQKSLEVYFNYSKKFGKLNLDITGGHSYQNTKQDSFNTGNLNNPQNVINSNNYYLNPIVKLESYFGRANVGFDSKYLLTLNLRRDTSNRFDPSNQTAIFPGAAFAWVASNEGFLKDSKSITSLKFRAGWGQTGQQDMNYNYFPYLPTYLGSNVGSSYYFGNTAYSPVSPLFYTTLLKWETVTSTNFGIDFELFKKVKGSLDVFQKETQELLAKGVPYPDGANLSNNGPRNFGNLIIQGVEFNLNADIINTNNFNWNLNFNTNFQRREITATAVDGTDSPGIPWGGIAGGIGNNIQIQSTGFAPSSFYVYEQVYGTDGKPIEGAFVDRNEDGIINSKDMYHYKKPYADFNFGLMSNMTYKKWDFSMAWRASLGNYNYNNTDSSRGYLAQSISQITPLNNISPSFFDTGFVNEGNNRYFSDYYIQDASFVRLDNISLGYNIMEPFGKDTNIKLSFGVQNALIITKYKGLDPEVFGGIDNVIYPRARMYVVGCNVNF